MLRKLSIMTFFIFFCFIVIQQAFAAYLEFVPTEIIQPEGEIISCYASGDEFFNWLHDVNGFTIIVGIDGYYYYGITDGDDVVPTSYRVNSVDPASVGLSPWVKISERAYQERRAIFNDPIERSTVRAPHTGTMNNLVVYIRFADDTEFTIPRSTYDANFNDLSGSSVRSYFQEVSYDQLDIVSHHYPICDLTTNLSYQDSNPRGYYQPYHEVNNPIGYTGGDNGYERRIREHTLLQNAILAIRSQVPTDLNIDGDNDGYVDNVSFIIRGNSGGWAELLWAHRWVLYTYDVRINNKRVWDYTFQPENQCDVYVLCHELFHALGAPDLYHYSYDGFVPAGPWDLMHSGFVHMGAWMKYKYANQAWISNIPELTTSGTYTLNPLSSATNNAYRIASPFSATEFFVVEYRKQMGLFESNLPGSGLLVYRIDSTLNGNAQGPPDEVYIYRPNGTPTENGLINSAHYNSSVGRTEINDYTTNPISFLYNGGPGGLNIHSIGIAGETISFTINIGLPEIPINPQPEDEAFFVYLNNPLSWTNGGGATGYYLSVWKNSPFEYLLENHYLEDTTYLLSSPFETLTTYYWRVDAVNMYGTEIGDVWSFTTGTELEPLAVNIGTGSTLANYIPLNMYWKNSLTQTIYYASDIGTEGLLTQITYYNNFVTNLPGKPVKIWVGETSLSNLSSGWIPSTSLNLVFDGLVDFPAGVNNINIPLQIPYQYNGQNLVVMVNRPMDNQYYNSNDRFYVTSTAVSNRTRYQYSDSTTYDPANPSGGTLTNQVPNTTLLLQTEATDQPEILISPDMINKLMMMNSQSSEVFVIDNQGSGELEYRITITSGDRRDSLDRSIIGSTLTCSEETFLPGTTEDWVFTVFNASTDNEWLKDVYITFPTGVVVNSATPFVGGTGGNMNPDTTSGHNIQIHWHGSGSSGWGVVYPNQSAVATVNVTILSPFVGDIELPFQINGDEYGSQPHTLNGIITLENVQDEINWLSVTPVSGTILPTGSQEILVEFDSNELTLGNYSKTIVVTNTDPNSPQIIIPVNLNVTDLILDPPQNVSISIENGWIELSWDIVVGADQYIVEVTDDINSEFSDISSSQGEFADNENRITWSMEVNENESILLFRVKAVHDFQRK
ncbi:MAG: M6 family metalloprotease domain-containing protein [Candidatus Cloacimonetes bacterium]|nr:M6 family metalloprotease domain-containing protein [Candidatus Cloacimonadota bacterium]